jgi:hypothetical protein
MLSVLVASTKEEDMFLSKIQFMNKDESFD